MKLEIIEHCFGPDVRIDGESLHKHEYDTRTDEEISSLKDKLLKELSDVKSELDLQDWMSIVNIIVYRNQKFNHIEEESHTDKCDQCGNYNYRETYKKESENE